MTPITPLDLAEALGAVLRWVTDPDSIEDCKTDPALRVERELCFARADQVHESWLAQEAERRQNA